MTQLVLIPELKFKAFPYVCGLVEERVWRTILNWLTALIVPKVSDPVPTT